MRDQTAPATPAARAKPSTLRPPASTGAAGTATGTALLVRAPERGSERYAHGDAGGGAEPSE